MTVQELLQLAGENGKVVIVNAIGNVEAVLVPYIEYQKLSLPKSGTTTDNAIKEQINPETVNAEITQAQLEEVIAIADGGTAQSELAVVDSTSSFERIDQVISKRAQDLFRSVPGPDASLPDTSLPVAPSAANQNQTSFSDEEIKPNFDDI